LRRFWWNLTFNYTQLGWDSSGAATAPNYGPIQFFINKPSNLSSPGTPDWSNNTQTGFTNPQQDNYVWDGQASIPIPAGTHSLTWRAQKTNTTYDEDSYWIDNIVFTPNTGETTDEKWLIMSYQDGDCNLEDALWTDVNEMEYGLYQLNATVRQNVKYIVLWDGHPSSSGGYSSSSPTGSVLYELGTESSQNTTISSSTINKSSSASWLSTGEVNMGDGNTLKNFLQWCRTNYPGYNNHVLIISNHGGGARGPKPGTKAVAWDETSGDDFLETMEVSTAIANAGYSTTDKLAIVGMDACLMATVEEAYQLRNVAKYFVTSVESEQGDGWNTNIG
jgi:hypothetical protein